jgi:lysophospholipase L1-like esterase
LLLKCFVSMVTVAALSGVLCASDAPIHLCKVTAHKTVGSGKLFQMVVFGDSVTWGDGLRETMDQTPGHKFSALVADWLAQNSGRSVERIVYAHSQASILSSDTVSDTGARWPGDVNSFYSTISDQAECVPTETRADIELVLMNGCINDVGPFEVVSPANSTRKVAKLTRRFCGPPVESVLRKVATLYPRAVIIMVGYYPIISEQSDIDPFLDFLRLFFPEHWGHLPSKLKQPEEKDRAKEKSKSAENSTVFYDRSNELFGNAVNHVNRDLRNPRLYFVKVPFAAENAFGAHPNSYLWPIPTLLAMDEVYLDRQEQCLGPFALDPINLAVCDLDPAAHPNPAGAKVYADEIVKVLSTYVIQWKNEADQAPTN